MKNLIYFFVLFTLAIPVVEANDCSTQDVGQDVTEIDHSISFLADYVARPETLPKDVQSAFKRVDGLNRKLHVHVRDLHLKLLKVKREYPPEVADPIIDRGVNAMIRAMAYQTISEYRQTLYTNVDYWKYEYKRKGLEKFSIADEVFLEPVFERFERPSSNKQLPEPASQRYSTAHERQREFFRYAAIKTNRTVAALAKGDIAEASTVSRSLLTYLKKSTSDRFAWHDLYALDGRIQRALNKYKDSFTGIQGSQVGQQLNEARRIVERYTEILRERDS